MGRKKKLCQERASHAEFVGFFSCLHGFPSGLRLLPEAPQCAHEMDQCLHWSSLNEGGGVKGSDMEGCPDQEGSFLEP